MRTILSSMLAPSIVLVWKTIAVNRKRSPKACMRARIVRLGLDEYLRKTSPTTKGPCMAYLYETLAAFITAATLRLAIRAKLNAGGVGKRAISVLINDYAVPDPSGNERTQMGTPRLPVENIPHGRRAAFLEALEALKGCDDRIAD
jgi:hypothetical protein